MSNKLSVHDLGVPWVRVGDRVYTGDAKDTIRNEDVPDSVLKVLIESVEDGLDD